MKHEVIIRDTADLDRAAAEFLDKIGDNTLVAFFAPMGAGKTTIGKKLAKALEYEFIDTDEWIEKEQGRKISDIFASNNFSSNINIVDGIIQALLYFREKGITLKQREHIRASLQLLNAIGGSVILDGLDKDEIEKIVINNIYRRNI